MSASFLEQPSWRLCNRRSQQTIIKCTKTLSHSGKELRKSRCIPTAACAALRELYTLLAKNALSATVPEVLSSDLCHIEDSKNFAVRSGAWALALALFLTGNVAIVHAEETVATSGAALELQQAYDKYSSKYDELDGGAAAEALGFPQLRKKLLDQARGNVLEVAVGTGLNLPYYRWAAAVTSGPQQQQQPAAVVAVASESDVAEEPSAAAKVQGAAAVDSHLGVTSLSAVDLSPGMLLQAKRRVVETALLSDMPISFRQADVAALPFPDSSFDSVVDTFSLCVFPNPQAALNEMARVVRPASEGGLVLLLEHCRSDNPLLAAYQDATAGPVAALGKGCVWNQDVEAMAARAGLRAVSRERAAAGTVQLIVAAKQ